MRILMRISGLLMVFLLLGSRLLYAQNTEQPKQAAEKRDQFNFSEKLFVHTDKDLYLTGEYIWFKVYYTFNGADQSHSLSKLCYVEILDKNNGPVLQAKIALNASSGNGALYVPVTLQNGTYKMRAYTNWMKNFGPEAFFEKQITIINPLISPEKQVQTKNTTELQFFPEGGDLVEDIPGVVAFKANDGSGNGININGVLINQKNDTLARINSLKFGMGRFSFTPKAGDSYKVIATTEQRDVLIKTLPPVKKSGYVMTAKENSKDELSLLVNTNTNNKMAYLVIYSGEKASIRQDLNLIDGKASILLAKNKLSDGVSKMTLFSADGNPVCERLYFKRPLHSLRIEAGTPGNDFGNRKKVDINLSTTTAGAPSPANLSIAVHHVNPLEVTGEMDITAYLWLGSELKGYIEHPGYYLSQDQDETNLALDNLMLTHGWRHFVWKDVPQDQNTNAKYLPEYNGHIISGKVLNQNGHPAQETFVNMSVPGKRVQYYTSVSDSSGNFLFNTKDFYGNNEMVIQTNYLADTTKQISINNPFFDQYTSFKAPDLKITPASLSALQENSLAMQVQNLYSGNQFRQFYNPNADSTAFYGLPEKTYILNEFTRFTTMEEVLREFVPEVSISRKQKHYHLSVITATANFLDPDPLVLVDGVPYFNMDEVVALDPLKMERLEVVNARYYYGPNVSEGILNFKSFKGDLAGTPINAKALVLDYEGMQLQREFYSPLYDTEAKLSSRIPDFRNTLFWSPSVITDKTGKTTLSFYTGDETGTYVGVVQGIDQNGKPGTKVFTFEVKK